MVVANRIRMATCVNVDKDLLESTAKGALIIAVVILVLTDDA